MNVGMISVPKNSVIETVSPEDRNMNSQMAKVFHPKLIVNDQASRLHESMYVDALREALFTHFERPYKAPEIPQSVFQEGDGTQKFVCRQCKDSFHHHSSLEEHNTRGSWILGYWCTSCFQECEHLAGKKLYCGRCIKLQIQKFKALQDRGLKKTDEPGIVRIFFNPCQLLEHIQMHNKEEISMHQLMLLPFPSGIGKEYFPHLKMISEALMDSMFLRNTHIVDWLLQNKINKWWRMAKGDNPVANIIKKYPFEVQQIKQLLNCNSKVNQRKNPGNITTDVGGSRRMNFLAMPFLNDKNCKSIRLSNDRKVYSQSPCIVQNVDQLPRNLSIESNTMTIADCAKDARNPFGEAESEKYPSIHNLSQTATSQVTNPFLSPPKGKISVKKFAKISPSPPTKQTTLRTNSTFRPVHESDITSSSRVVTIRSAKPVNLTSLIKNFPQIAHKVANKKIVFIRKNVPKNFEVEKVNNIRNHMIQTSDSLHQDLIKNIEGNVVHVHQIPDNILYKMGHRSINSQIRHISTSSQLTNSDAVIPSLELTKKFPPTVRDYSPLLLPASSVLLSHNQENSPVAGLGNDLNNTSRKANSGIVIQIEDDLELFLAALREESSKELRKFFHEDELMFLTVVRNEKTGKSFLGVACHDDNEIVNSNSFYREKMFSFIARMNETQLYRRINHIQTMSEEYSKKFGISDDRLIDEHRTLVSLLRNVVSQSNLSVQSSSDNDFSSLVTPASGKKCSTCHKMTKSESYMIEFSRLAPEIDYCLCYDFICHKCNVFQGNEERFHAHLNYHAVRTPHTCPECNIEFSSHKELSIHIWTECFHLLTRRILRCQICNIGGFCDLKSIVNHFITMHSFKIVVCNLCCMVFECEQSCQSHMKSTHLEVEKCSEPLLLTWCQLDDRVVPVECYSLHLKKHKCVQESLLFMCSFCQDDNKLHRTKKSILTHLYALHRQELSWIIDDEESLQGILNMQNLKNSTNACAPTSNCISETVQKISSIDDAAITSFSDSNIEECRLPQNDDSVIRLITETDQIKLSECDGIPDPDIIHSKFLQPAIMSIENDSFQPRSITEEDFINIRQNSDFSSSDHINGNIALSSCQSSQGDTESSKNPNSPENPAEDDCVNLSSSSSSTATRKLDETHMENDESRRLSQETRDRGESHPEACGLSDSMVVGSKVISPYDELLDASARKALKESASISTGEISTVTTDAPFEVKPTSNSSAGKGTSAESEREKVNILTQEKDLNGSTGNNTDLSRSRALQHVEVGFEEDISIQTKKQSDEITPRRSHSQAIENTIELDEQNVPRILESITRNGVEKLRDDDSDIEEFSLEIDESIEMSNVSISTDDQSDEVINSGVKSSMKEDKSIREKGNKTENVMTRSESIIGADEWNTESISENSQRADDIRVQNDSPINNPISLPILPETSVEEIQNHFEAELDSRPGDNEDNLYNTDIRSDSYTYHRQEDGIVYVIDDSNAKEEENVMTSNTPVAESDLLNSERETQQSSNNDSSEIEKYRTDFVKATDQKNNNKESLIQSSSNEWNHRNLVHELVSKNEKEKINGMGSGRNLESPPHADDHSSRNLLNNHQGEDSENSNFVTENLDTVMESVGTERDADEMYNLQTEILEAIRSREAKNELHIGHEPQKQSSLPRPISSFSQRTESLEIENVDCHVFHEDDIASSIGICDNSRIDRSELMANGSTIVSEKDLPCGSESVLLLRQAESTKDETGSGIACIKEQTHSKLTMSKKHRTPVGIRNNTMTCELMMKKKRYKKLRCTSNMESSLLNCSSNRSEENKKNTSVYDEENQDNVGVIQTNESSDHVEGKSHSEHKIKDGTIGKSSKKPEVNSDLGSAHNHNDLIECHKLNKVVEIPLPNIYIPQLSNELRYGRDDKVPKTPAPLSDEGASQKKIVAIQKRRQSSKKKKQADRISNRRMSEVDKDSNVQDSKEQPTLNAIKKCDHYELKNLPLTDDEKITLSKSSHNHDTDSNDQSMNQLKTDKDTKQSRSRGGNAKSPGITAPVSRTNRKMSSNSKTSRPSNIVTSLKENNQRKIERRSATLHKQKSSILQTNNPKESSLEFRDTTKKCSAQDLFIHEKHITTSKTTSADSPPEVLEERLRQIGTLKQRKFEFSEEYPLPVRKKSKSRDHLHQQIPRLRLIRAFPQASSSDNIKNPKNESISQILGKKKIAFTSHTKSPSEVLGFNCHLCGDPIDTAWITLKKHYDSKHLHSHEICTIALRLTDVDTNTDGVDSTATKKRKSTEIPSSCDRKRRKRGQKRMHENSTISIEQPFALGVELESPEGGSRYLDCGKCGKSCDGENELRRHIVNKHRLARKNFICLECGENVVNFPNLQKHLKEAHRVDNPIEYINKHPESAPKNYDLEAKQNPTVTNQRQVCIVVSRSKLSVRRHAKTCEKASSNRKNVDFKSAQVAPTNEVEEDEDSQELNCGESNSNRDHMRNTDMMLAKVSQSRMHVSSNIG